ncbi:MAG TPA: chloride channel protein [Anaeromyxobacteraceae bacterium]|nr:chloride channel protein [Anaeromyxobacteraceae bacterium]
MASTSPPVPDGEASPSSARPAGSIGGRTSALLRLVATSLAVGGATGVVCAAFRLALNRGNVLREAALAFSKSLGWWGWLLPIAGAAAAAGFARWLVVRFAPDAAGSGVPQVEGVVRDGAALDGLRVLPVKFLGGLTAIGAGLALGREGPSVQMGAAIGGSLGRRLRLAPGDDRVLVAGGAAAGLATAFGAPLGGAVFVLEEVMQRFHGRTAIAVLGATGAATAVAHSMLGSRPLFTVGAIAHPLGLGLFVYLVFGLALGGLGALYNRLVLYLLDQDERVTSVRTELRAAAVGAAVGLLACLNPLYVGGGEGGVQRLLLGPASPVGALVLYGAIRFLLGPLSYASRTPGGLFAPLLLVGGAVGVIVGRALHAIVPVLVPDPIAFVIVGAAAFFTATVRAPVTGIALLVEMTAVNSLIMPMLAAACGAFVGASLLGSAPIYDSLRERLGRDPPAQHPKKDAAPPPG